MSEISTCRRKRNTAGLSAAWYSYSDEFGVADAYAARRERHNMHGEFERMRDEFETCETKVVPAPSDEDNILTP